MHFLPALTAAAFLLPATAVAPAIAQPIYRCGNTYSQEACKGGKVVEDKTTTLHSGHSGSTVYLCKGHGGGLFWSSHQCGQHNAFLERTEIVPSGLPWDQKVAQAEAQWRKTQRNTAAPAVVIKTVLPSLPSQAKNKSVMHWKNVLKLWIAWDVRAVPELNAQSAKIGSDQKYQMKC